MQRRLCLRARDGGVQRSDVHTDLPYSSTHINHTEPKVFFVVGVFVSMLYFHFHVSSSPKTQSNPYFVGNRVDWLRHSSTLSCTAMQ